MIYNSYLESNHVDLNDIEIDESIVGEAGGLETLIWIEKENRKFIRECLAKDAKELILGEAALNESAGEWIKDKLIKLKEFIKKVFAKVISMIKGFVKAIKNIFTKGGSDDSKSTALSIISNDELQKLSHASKNYVDCDIDVVNIGKFRSGLNEILSEYKKNMGSLTSAVGNFDEEDVKELSNAAEELEGSMDEISEDKFKEEYTTKLTKFGKAEAEEFAEGSLRKSLLEVEKEMNGICSDFAKTQNEALKYLDNIIKIVSNANKAISGKEDKYSSQIYTQVSKLSNVMSTAITKSSSLVTKFLHREFSAKKQALKELKKLIPNAGSKAAKGQDDKSSQNESFEIYDEIDLELDLL
jgi:phage-related protein